MRRLGRNATTLPGKVALRLYRNLPSYLTKYQNVTLITGTNGKTTTTKMLCSIYESLGFRVVTNVSGANLASGVATAMIEGLSFSDISNKGNKAKGKPIRLILEIDEAAFGRYAAFLHPKVIAVTNLFRDQLDRYGELSKTRELIRKGILESEQADVLLCADDSLCASLSLPKDFMPDSSGNQQLPSAQRKEQKRRILFCGMEKDCMVQNTSNRSATTEAGNCVFCGAAYRYSHRSFGHLGYYQCPNCGFSRPDTDFHGDYAMLRNNQYKAAFWWSAPKAMEGRASFESKKMEVILPIPGEHNVYNAMTAIGAACMNGTDLMDTKKGILETKAGFGRMERFWIKDREACIVLVKNPVGLERALDFLANATDAGSVLFLLNDGIADGTDVSWIWDVDFESKKFPRQSFVSGTRCYDMALRLQYAGVAKDKISVSYDAVLLFEKALSECSEGECLYVLPNYTSLLELRSYLARKYHLKEIWK